MIGLRGKAVEEIALFCVGGGVIFTSVSGFDSTHQRKELIKRRGWIVYFAAFSLLSQIFTASKNQTHAARDSAVVKCQ